MPYPKELDYNSLIAGFEAFEAIAGPTDTELVIDAANQIVEDAVAYARDHGAQVAAAGIAVATLASGLSHISKQQTTHSPTKIETAMPTGTAAGISLISAEKDAAQTIIKVSANPKSKVHLAPAAAQVIKLAASGHQISPSELTTTAEVSDAANAGKVQVTIEKVATVTAESIPQAHTPAVSSQASGMELSVPEPKDVKTIYSELASKNPSTLVAPANLLPPNAKEIVNGTTVSPSVAAQSLGNSQNSLIVSIDPATATEASHATTTTSTTSTTTAPAPTPKHIYDPTNSIDVENALLKQDGINSPMAREAILGNEMEESGIQNGRLQGSAWASYATLSELPTSTLHSSIGGGEAMWTPIIKVIDEAKALGVDPNTYDGQTKVLVHDLEQPDIKNPGHTYLQSIEDAPNLDAATYVDMHDWERPDQRYEHYKVRKNYAEAIHEYLDYNKPLNFSAYRIPSAPNINTTTTTTPETTTVPPSTTTTPPQAGNQNSNTEAQYLATWAQQQNDTTDTAPSPTTSTTIEAAPTPTNNPNAVIGPDNVVFQSQLDDKFNQYSYGSGTLKTSGCALFSISTVASTLLNKPVPVLEVYQEAQSIQANTGKGTEWSKIVEMVQGYGLSVQEAPDSLDTFKLIDHTLQQKGMVIIAGTGSAPFTEYGHVLVIRGKASDGTYLVADSNSDVNNPGNPQNSYSATELITAIDPSKAPHTMGIFLVTNPKKS